jgi:hypothetical protein
MKHLKLFEELEGHEFVEQVKDIFSDLIDDDKCEIEDVDDWGDYDIVLGCKLPNADIETISYNKFIQQSKLYYEDLNNIDSCVERLKKHSDFDFTLDYDLYSNSDETSYLILMFKEGKSQIGQFYRKNLNGSISLDKSELKNLLNLNKTSTTIRVVGGSYGRRLHRDPWWTLPRLSIQFVNNASLEEHKESLIVNIRKLKIEGEQFIFPISWGKSRLVDYQTQGDGKTIEFGINPKIDIN